MQDQEITYQLCFNQEATNVQVTCIAILYLIAVSIFFGSLIYFLHVSRSNIILRERSCNILIAQSIATYGYLIIYPFAIICSNNYNYSWTSYIIMIFFIAQFKYIPLLCYLMRACRFLYVFCKPYRWLTLRGGYLAIVLFSISILIGMLDVVMQFDKNIFYEVDPIQAVIFSRIGFVYLSQLILILSLFFVRKVNRFQQFDYWIALALEIVSFWFKVYLKNIVLFTDCDCDYKIPLYYYIDCIKVTVMLICSTVLPMYFSHKSISDLPFEMQCQNFNFFISQPKFVEIFYQFLIYYDNNNDSRESSRFRQRSSVICINNNNTTFFEENSLSTLTCYQTYFSYYIKLILLFNAEQQTEQKIQQQLKIFFSDHLVTQQLSAILPQTIMNKIQSELQQESQIESEIAVSQSYSEKSPELNQLNLIELAWHLKEILQEILRINFENHYKFTNSYQTLYSTCEQNRMIWIRLGKIGLTCTNCLNEL